MTPEELTLVCAAEELEIAARRWTPIWVVCVGAHPYVRSWYRRDTGWFAHVLKAGRAAVRVPGLEIDVTVEDIGALPAGLRSDIDAAYRTKYGRYGAGGVGPMVTDAAAATTLRLS